MSNFFKNICFHFKFLFYGSLLMLLVIFYSVSCINVSSKNGGIDNQFQHIEKNQLRPLGIRIDYPREGTIFPPEFPPPKFLWHDSLNVSTKWNLRISTQNGTELFREIVDSMSWRPDLAVWLKLKTTVATEPVFFTVIGTQNGNADDNFSSGKASFSFSKDSVGASVFYRAVPLPFSYAVKRVNEIEWYLGNINGGKPHKILDNIPVCANCHSFSGNGQFAMDVDYANDKGSYIIAPVKDTIHMTFDKIITWSDYKREEGGATFGLLSQISPNGRYVLSTVKDRSVFVPVDNLEYSQLFFPIKGILALYDRNTKKYAELPGASDKAYVQSNPNWSPNGNEVLFSRASRYKNDKIDNSESVLLKPEDVQEFITGKQEFKFDLYRIPFNEGMGGQAVPVQGASNNKKSNFFARYSSDGKWVVFCQSENFMLLQPDSKLYIMPANGGIPRLMNCNTKKMNSWHSWSPNSKWLVFSSKNRGPYTQLYLTHIDENGNDSPPVFLENLAFCSKAANIPEFFNPKVSGLNKMADDFSGDALYYTRLAALSIAEKRYKDALKYVEDAIKKDSSFYDAYEQKLYVNFNLRNSKSKGDLRERMIAKRLIENQIHQNPGDKSLYIKRGNLRLMLGDYKGALQDGMYILKLNANDYSGHELVVAIYQTVGQSEKAIPYQKKMLELQPDNVSLTNTLSLLYYETHQLDQAFGLLNVLIKNYPKKADFYVSRAGLFLMKGDQLNAKADYNRAISVDPNNYASYRARGNYYLRISSSNLAMNDFNKAIELLGKDLHENPQNAPLLLIRAEIMEQINNSQGALAEYENYLKNWPINYTVLKSLAQKYYSLKKWKQAIDSYSLIIENFPLEIGAFFNRGLTYMQSGNSPKALDDLNTAILRNPNEYNYFHLRSAIKSKLGDRAGSTSDLKTTSDILKEISKTRKLEQNEQDLLTQIQAQLHR